MVRAKQGHIAASRPRARVPTDPWGTRLTALTASAKKASVAESAVSAVPAPAT